MPSPEGALDQSHQLIGSPIDGLLQSRRLVSDRDRLAALQTGFQHAALVVRAALLAILIGQMNLYTRNVIADPVQGGLNNTADVIRKGLVTSNVVVCIDLDVHITLLW
jgi:hypothetical protein